MICKTQYGNTGQDRFEPYLTLPFSIPGGETASPNSLDERSKRQFENWPLITVGPCYTSTGRYGRCTSFRHCFPYFKLPDLNTWDSWVLGMYDTCTYFTATGKQV